MSDKMAPFREVVSNRHEWIAGRKKETGRKLAGYFCDYVPEEVLYAAGYDTIRITGGVGNVEKADNHLQSNVCSFSRRCFEQALQGVFDYLDGLVVPHACDVITKMYDLWAYRMESPDFIHYVWVPHKVFDKNAQAVMVGEIKRLKKELENHLGTEISDDSLREAIKIYDETRRLMKRVYRLRASNPPVISGRDAFTVALASILAPREDFNRWARDYLAEMEGKESSLERRPRVLVTASMLEDLDLIGAIEDSGAWVVADDVCTGSRYFWDEVGEDLEKPIDALAKRYLNKLPCPRSVGSMAPRREHILSLGDDYAVDGVIFYILRCCDAQLFQYPLLNQRTREAGHKVLYIQGDQTAGINEAITNRVKAFTEILGE